VALILDSPLPANSPCAIAAEEIAAIQRIAGSGNAVEPWPYLQAGQMVRILDGPLFGIDGILVQLKNRRRLVVSLPAATFDRGRTGPRLHWAVPLNERRPSVIPPALNRAERSSFAGTIQRL
jgi:hypothetical protein